MNWEYIIAAIIVALVIPLIQRGWAYLGLKTKNTKWENFFDEVTRIVNAGEQMYKAGKLDDRLTYAEEALQNWLDKHGLKLDINMLRAYIEAEVGYLPPTHEVFK